MDNTPYHILPQFAAVLKVPVSHSTADWLLVHWFVSVCTVLCAIIVIHRNELGEMEIFYRTSNFVMALLALLNISHLGHLPSYIATFINGFCIVVLISVAATSMAKEQPFRWIAFLVLTFPLAFDHLGFFLYCLKLNSLHHWILFILLEITLYVGIPTQNPII